jgi:hypothetical protein
MSENRDGLEPDEPLDLDLDVDADDPDPEELDVDDSPEPEPEPEPQPRQQTRTERQMAALRRRTQEQEAELRRLREIAIARPQPAPQPQIDQAAADRAELERVAQLSYDEQARYWGQRAEQRTQQAILRQSLETKDMLDRMSFQQLQNMEPAARRLAKDVEDGLALARSRGMNPSREEIYNLLLGQELRRKSQSQTEKQRRAGQQRVASQQVRPQGAASSVGGGPRDRRAGNTDAELDARLKSVTVGDYTRMTS